MRIATITIYGFGKLKDITLTFQKGINIIEGLNEAGKSTVMAFIRGILFGFENRRNPHLRYEPILGGRFGGAMELIDEQNNIYRIERIFNQKISGDVKVFLPDGRTTGEEYLPFLIGKVNERVFKQIFSFGLTELQQIDTLQDDQINDFIYHAGTGFVQQILKLKQFLEQKQQELFKPSGQKPIINALIGKLEDTNNSLEELRQVIGNHQHIVNRIEALELEIKQLELIRDTNKEELKWLEKLHQYYKPFQRIGEIDQELKVYSKPVIFPNNGIERYESYESKVKELELELQQLQEKRKQLETDIARIEVNPFYIDQEAKITNLKEELTTFNQQGIFIQSLQQDLDHLEVRINGHLQQLGLELHREKIREVEITLQDKQKLQELGREMEQKQRTLSELNKEIELKKQRYSQIKEGLKLLLEEKNPILKQNVVEEVYRNSIKAYQSIKDKKWKQEQFVQQQEAYLLQAKEFDSQGKNYVTFIFSAVAFITGIFMIVFGQWMYSPIFLGLSVFLLFFNHFGGNRNKRIQENLRKVINRVELDKKVIVEEIEKLEDELTKELSKLNIDYLDSSWLFILETQYKEWLEHRQKEHISFNQIESFQSELKKLEYEIAKLIEGPQQTLIREIFVLQNDWNNWLTSHQLQPDISPVVVFDTISMLKEVKEWIYQGEAIKSKLEIRMKQKKEFEEGLNRLIAENNVYMNGSVEEKVYHLFEKLKLNKENKLRFLYLSEKREELEENIALIQNKLKQEQQFINELFSFASVNNRESFYSKAREYEKYEGLNQEKSQLIISIQTQLGSEQEFNLLLEELRVNKLDIILEKLKDLKEHQVINDGKIKAVSEEKGRLQNQLKQMEANEQLTVLNQEYVNLKAELKLHTKDWVTVNIAKHLLDRTMKIYETEKQPMVIKKASGYFNVLTGGLYTKIISPLGQNQIEVIRNDEQRFTPQYLSRGTIEQLFLAMRFALVDEFSKQIALPIILDDIFVNFDRKRLSHSLTVLQELGKRHQIILFTCHEHVTMNMQRNSNEVHILNL